ncbi:hypothetical protein AAY473_022463 [Plecturocebus cupreus]
MKPPELTGIKTFICSRGREHLPPSVLEKPCGTNTTRQSVTLPVSIAERFIKWREGREQCTPVILALWEAKAGGSPEHFGRPRWADHLRLGVQDQPDQHGKTLSLLKIQKISRSWWHMPVAPATWEAEAIELLEPGRWRLCPSSAKRTYPGSCCPFSLDLRKSTRGIDLRLTHRYRELVLRDIFVSNACCDNYHKCSGLKQ